MKSVSPIVKDLVLIGGGHAHVSVLKSLGMKPIEGLRVTLITRDIHTPYSGMLPGYISGFYDYDQCHIDLGPLARFANARLIHSQVHALNTEKRLIEIPDRPPIHYDVLSINTGSTPSTLDIPGVHQYALIAKPIDQFLQRWDDLKRRVINSSGDFTINIVGGGAGGVELALSTHHQLSHLLKKANDDPNRLKFRLLTSSEHIMHGHNKSVRKRFERVFSERNIKIETQCFVNQVTQHTIETDKNQTFDSQAVIWVTTASAPSWPKQAGLATDEHGFIQVNQQLQSLNQDDIFAAGDIASLPDPRPKSGVFAVRQGEILAHNLRASATQRPLKKYKPQKNFLGLISTGDRYAIASRGQWAYEAAWLWKFKDFIDVSFMKKFNELPEMDIEQPTFNPSLLNTAQTEALTQHTMRCGGCGAKVSSSVLTRVMQRLPSQQRDDIIIGRNEPDDCAMIDVPLGKTLVQSVDYFRAFLNDDYTFGAIAANHALGDLFAMGAEAQSALAIATLPFAKESIIEESLYQLLSGALSKLEECNAVLSGGHSSEGVEIAFGLTVNGLVDKHKEIRKSGLQIDDALILTKPLGTGTLMAADMQQKAKGRWVDNAIQHMLQSNYQASQCMRHYQVSACTDVTGFGLIGHLNEMTLASNLSARINIDALPLLSGSLNCIQKGIVSSLQPANLKQNSAIENVSQIETHPKYRLLFDPQTAGGLLFSIPKHQAEACKKDLVSLGYLQAEIIGTIKPNDNNQPLIRVNTNF